MDGGGFSGGIFFGGRQMSLTGGAFFLGDEFSLLEGALLPWCGARAAADDAVGADVSAAVEARLSSTCPSAVVAELRRVAIEALEAGAASADAAASQAIVAWASEVSAATAARLRTSFAAASLAASPPKSSGASGGGAQNTHGCR